MCLLTNHGMGFDTQTASAYLPFIDKAHCTCSTKEKQMSLVYFVCPIVCLQGAVQTVLAEFLHHSRGFFGFPELRWSTELPLWDLHPPRMKEKAEIRDYIMATERNVLTRTKHYLVKSNGKDLNLVNGNRELFWCEFFVFCSVALPNISYRWGTGVEGFEPSGVAVKAPCLTSWRYPIG